MNRGLFGFPQSPAHRLDPQLFKMDLAGQPYCLIPPRVFNSRRARAVLIEGFRIQAATDDLTLSANVSDDGGVSFKTSYQSIGYLVDATAISVAAFGSATAINIDISSGTTRGVINSQTGPANFRMFVQAPYDNFYPSGDWVCQFRDSGVGLVTVYGSFHWPTAVRWNAMRIWFGSGNPFSNGEIRASWVM